MKDILLQMTIVASFLIAGSAVASIDHGHSKHANHGATDTHQEMRTVESVGTVQSIAADGSSVVLAHEPIAELRWPAMTMEMVLADPDLAELVTVEDRVSFVLRQTGATDYEIVSIESVAAQ